MWWGSQQEGPLVTLGVILDFKETVTSLRSIQVWVVTCSFMPSNATLRRLRETKTITPCSSSCRWHRFIDVSFSLFASLLPLFSLVLSLLRLFLVMYAFWKIGTSFAYHPHSTWTITYSLTYPHPQPTDTVSLTLEVASTLNPEPSTLNPK